LIREIRGLVFKMSQQSKAEAFRALHRGPEILVLPNAWDAVSARIFEQAGFPAIATTSGGIAFSLGYPDGQRIPREEMLAQIARIVRAVDVPVTADVEGGYEDAAHTARDVISTGAVGLNLEDATGDPAHPLEDLPRQVEKIKAVIAEGKTAGVALVLNARTDVYLAQVGVPESRYEEALKRLLAFKAAGADCLFAPGIRDTATIEKLVSDLKFPLNILVGPGSPSAPELHKLGVARLSVGSGVMRATLGVAQRAAKELRASGTYSAMENAVAYDELNGLMAGTPHRRKPLGNVI
jgi:2-methylisocitrate lyase-like PEP mutase family enzyme